MPQIGICIGETGLQKQWNFARTIEWLLINQKKKIMQLGKTKNLEVYFNGSKTD